ncbi:MAG TPA: hypothetical protein VHL08_08910 [Dongiaceae bacterium]|jgi:hypothetical protein|nr:hypothetical protein [Dongiaceae bacterium]
MMSEPVEAKFVEISPRRSRTLVLVGVFLLGVLAALASGAAFLRLWLHNRDQATRQEIANLSDRLASFEQRLAHLPPPDLSGIEDRLSGLEKIMAQVAGMPARLDTLEARLATFDDRLARDERRIEAPAAIPHNLVAALALMNLRTAIASGHDIAGALETAKAGAPDLPDLRAFFTGIAALSTEDVPSRNQLLGAFPAAAIATEINRHALGGSDRGVWARIQSNLAAMVRIRPERPEGDSSLDRLARAELAAQSGNAIQVLDELASLPLPAEAVRWRDQLMRRLKWDKAVARLDALLPALLKA